MNFDNLNNNLNYFFQTNSSNGSISSGNGRVSPRTQNDVTTRKRKSDVADPSPESDKKRMTKEHQSQTTIEVLS